MLVIMDERASPLLGVVGAGTMGSGIGLAALYADLPVVLFDVEQVILQRAGEYIERFLSKKSLSARLAKLQRTTSLEDLADCTIVVEAAPEILELKQDLFARLDAILPPPAILATNTSTLSVTAIASVCSHPRRVGGMHFFNPAAVMRLVEVIQGAATDPQVTTRLMKLATRMGKVPVAAQDQPGFIVNRVARSFYGEALQMLGEGAGEVPALDGLVRSAGFAMGPFELMDLIGIDVNLAAAQSVYQRFEQAPRFRPHPIQESMVAAGRLGRKTLDGFYHYDREGRQADRTEFERPPVSGEGSLWIGRGLWDYGVTASLEAAGYQITDQPQDSRAAFVLVGREEGLQQTLEELDAAMPPDRPMFCQVNEVSRSQLIQWVDRHRRLVGIDALFFRSAGATYLVGEQELEPEVSGSAESVILGSGHAPAWFCDIPGTVLSRIVCTLANEVALAVQDGLAETDTIDTAMQLGASYPHGPYRWGRELGWGRVLKILEFLQRETGDPRYRPAPRLRAWADQDEFSD